MKISLKKRLVSVYGWSYREVKRVFRVWNQTIVGPFVESLMMIVLFSMFIKIRMKNDAASASVIVGLFGGVVGMTSTRNAFMATSFPLVIARMVGYVTDYTALPFAINNIRIGTVVGAIVRCVSIFILFLIASPFFGAMALFPFRALFFTLLSQS